MKLSPDRATSGSSSSANLKTLVVKEIAGRDGGGGEQTGRENKSQGKPTGIEFTIRDQTGRELDRREPVAVEYVGGEETGRDYSAEEPAGMKPGPREPAGIEFCIRDQTGRELGGGEPIQMQHIRRQKTGIEDSGRQQTGNVESYGSEKDRALSETDAEVNQTAESVPHSPEGNRKLTEVEVASAQMFTSDCDDDVFNPEAEAEAQQSNPVSNQAGDYALPPPDRTEESTFSEEIRKQIASARSSFTALILQDQFDFPPPPPPATPPPPPLPFSPPPSLPPAPFAFNGNAVSGHPRNSKTIEEVLLSSPRQTNPVVGDVVDVSWCPCCPTFTASRSLFSLFFQFHISIIA